MDEARATGDKRRLIGALFAAGRLTEAYDLARTVSEKSTATAKDFVTLAWIAVRVGKAKAAIWAASEAKRRDRRTKDLPPWTP